MDRAALDNPQGEIVSTGEFIARYRHSPAVRAIRTYCPECKQQTRVHISPLRVQADHFAHTERTGQTPFCRRRDNHDRTSARYYDAQDYSTGNGDRIRAALADPKAFHALWTATNVILNEQMSPIITPNQFRALTDEVQSLDRWSRAGMTVGIVPFVVLDHGTFSSGRNGSDRLLFDIKRDNREHAPVLVPVHIKPSGEERPWRRYAIDAATTRSLAKGAPALSDRDPVTALRTHLDANPPQWHARLNEGRKRGSATGGPSAATLF